MKKKILAVLITVALSISMIGCTESETTASKEYSNSMFIPIEKNFNWHIVYHSQTKVMYIVTAEGFGGRNFTLMVDADGNPLLWQE